MERLSREQFLSRKNSDTIVIYGSGYSINKITKSQWSELQKFDSIGFNWFLKSKKPVTFYLLREQDVWRRNGQGDESRQEVFDTIEKFYNSTCLIVSNLSTSAPKWAMLHHYARPIYQKKMPFTGVVLKEKFAQQSFREYKSGWPSRSKRYGALCHYFNTVDLFKDGIIYDFCSMISILHIVTFLKYKRIIFAGVDLYDHRYFWLGKNELRNVTKHSKRDLDSEHFVGDFTVGLVGTYNLNFRNTELYTVNPKSLLTKHIPVWETSVE